MIYFILGIGLILLVLTCGLVAGTFFYPILNSKGFVLIHIKLGYCFLNIICCLNGSCFDFFDSLVTVIGL
jgi:hypothetical protein